MLYDAKNPFITKTGENLNKKTENCAVTLSETVFKSNARNLNGKYGVKLTSNSYRIVED